MIRNLTVAFLCAILSIELVQTALADVNAGLAALERKDYATAYREFKPAADRGHLGAQYNIGQMYLQGFGVQKSDAEAAKWYRMAANKGLAEAQYMIGLLTLKGRGVKKDELAALDWYSKAAGQGLPYAQVALGRIYEDGPPSTMLGTDIVTRGRPDYKNAKKWFEKAAKQGDRWGQFSLGMLHAKSMNRMLYPNDPRKTEAFAEAYAWWNLAAKQGISEAKTNMDALSGDMIAWDRAKRLAKEYEAKYPIGK